MLSLLKNGNDFLFMWASLYYCFVLFLLKLDGIMVNSVLYITELLAFEVEESLGDEIDVDPIDDVVCPVCCFCVIKPLFLIILMLEGFECSDANGEVKLNVFICVIPFGPS